MYRALVHQSSKELADLFIESVCWSSPRVQPLLQPVVVKQGLGQNRAHPAHALLADLFVSTLPAPGHRPGADLVMEKCTNNASSPRGAFERQQISALGSQTR